MKRFISALITVIMIVSAMASSLATSATMLYRKGDLNHDGSINAMDSHSLKMSIAGASSGEVDSLAADTNSDGVVNAADSYAMKLHMAGKANLSEIYPEGSGWKGFTVMGAPISDYTILVTDPENANMVFAADELCKYVKLGDGETELSVDRGSSSAEKQIVLRADESGEMGTDGFNIKTEGDDLIITAGAMRGTMYAVYEILEEYFGYSFYSYGKYKLDKNSASDVPAGTDDTQIPRVRYRCICFDGFRNEYTESTVIKRKLSGCSVQSSMLQARYGYGIERVRANAHSFDVFIPTEDMQAAGLTKRCLSDNRSFEICVENMLELLDQRTAAGAVIGREITEISCSYAADDEPCTCRKCNQIINKGGRHTDNLCAFVNRVHPEIVAKYPDIRVIVNAYGNAADPAKGWHDAPVFTTLNEGITVLYCWNGCANHMLGHEGCTDKGNSLGITNKKAEADFLAWTEKCSDIYVWYYPTHIYYMLCPEPNFDNLYNDIKWFINNGANGFYVQGTDGGSFESMDGQLIAALMWNPDMTKEEYDLLIAEYLKDHYGYGWTYIREYMDMLIECGDLKGCVYNDFELPFDIYSKDYFKANYDKMCELFKKAMSQADTDEERFNIEKLSVHMHFLGLSSLYEDRYVNGSAAEKEAYAAQWRWTYDFINEEEMYLVYNKKGISSAFTLDINPLNQAYPEIGTGER